MTDQLPTNWESWSLAAVGEWRGGGTPSSSNQEFWDGDIPWVSPKDMKVSVIRSTQDRITAKAIEESAAKLIPAHSVLFVTRSGILAHSFPVATTGVAVTVNQDLKAITPVEAIEPDYLAWALRYLERQVLRSCAKHGTTVHSIEIPALKSLNVPVPPHNEQRRIVARIEELFSELDKGVEALTTARQQLAVYRHAILKHAFEGRLTEGWRAGNPHKVRLPAERLANIPTDLAGYCTEQWTWRQLGDVSEVTGGLTKNPKRSALPIKMKYLRVANVYADRLELDEITDIGVTENEFENVRLQPGDMLVVEGNGSVEQIGRVAIWNGEIQDVGHQNHLIRVRFIPGILPRFFLSFLMSPLGRDLIVRQASSTSGLHTLSISKVSGLPVPLPSTEEQEALLEALDAPLSEIENLTAEIEAGLARCKALHQSILKQAFSGQLVAQDPKAEPASVLLERIRAEREGEGPKKRRSSKNGKKEAA